MILNHSNTQSNMPFTRRFTFHTARNNKERKEEMGNATPPSGMEQGANQLKSRIEKNLK